VEEILGPRATRSPTPRPSIGSEWEQKYNNNNEDRKGNSDSATKRTKKERILRGKRVRKREKVPLYRGWSQTPDAAVRLFMLLRTAVNRWADSAISDFDWPR
jgi:hypothetical protein